MYTNNGKGYTEEEMMNGYGLNKDDDFYFKAEKIEDNIYKFISMTECDTVWMVDITIAHATEQQAKCLEYESVIYSHIEQYKKAD